MTPEERKQYLTNKIRHAKVNGADDITFGYGPATVDNASKTVAVVRGRDDEDSAQYYMDHEAHDPFADYLKANGVTAKDLRAADDAKLADWYYSYASSAEEGGEEALYKRVKNNDDLHAYEQDYMERNGVSSVPGDADYYREMRTSNPSLYYYNFNGNLEDDIDGNGNLRFDEDGRPVQPAPSAPAAPVAGLETPEVPEEPVAVSDASLNLDATANLAAKKIEPAAHPAAALAAPKVGGPAVDVSAGDDFSNLTRAQRIANLYDGIAAGKIDPVTATENLGKVQEQSAYDTLQGRRSAYEETANELRATEAGNERAARWTAAAEAVAAFGNVLGVAAGGRHQQYNSSAMDWMRQADASRRERIARITSLQDNLRLQEQRLQEMKAGNAAALVKAQEAKRTRDVQAKMQEAHANYYRAMADKVNAATDAERKAAEMKLQQERQKLKNLQEMENAIKAQANQRNAAADAAATRANAAAREAENRNKNRDSSTESRGKVDESKVGLNNAREKYWSEKDPNYYQRMKENTVEPGTGPLAAEGAAGGKDEKSKKKTGSKLDVFD